MKNTMFKSYANTIICNTDTGKKVQFCDSGIYDDEFVRHLAMLDFLDSIEAILNTKIETVWDDSGVCLVNLTGEQIRAFMPDLYLTIKNCDEMSDLLMGLYCNGNPNKDQEIMQIKIKRVIKRGLIDLAKQLESIL